MADATPGANGAGGNTALQAKMTVAMRVTPLVWTTSDRRKTRLGHTTRSSATMTAWWTARASTAAIARKCEPDRPVREPGECRRQPCEEVREVAELHGDRAGGAVG